MEKFNKYLLLLICLFLPFALFSNDSNSEGVTVSLNFENRNFHPGTKFKVYVELKNHLSGYKKIELLIETLNSNKEKEWSTVINLELAGGQGYRIPLLATAPDVTGECLIIANLKDGKNKTMRNVSIEEFIVHKPVIPEKLDKALIYVPEWEDELLHLVEDWDKKATALSWGQVMVCSRKTWKRVADNDNEAINLIEKALKRKMGVVFLDFGPANINPDEIRSISLPFGIDVKFTENRSPETWFNLISDNEELKFSLYDRAKQSWNGKGRIVVPAVDMKIISRGKMPQNLVQTGVNPFRFPVVKIPVKKGNIVLCQLITNDRLDEHSLKGINVNDVITYDPLAVQFIMNLISFSANEELLK